MRTTVTLDPDVERLIKDAMREQDLSFKEVLNSAARNGLTGQPKHTVKFVQKTYSMGEPQGFRWDKALSAAEAMEDEELLRKMTLLR